MNPDEISTALNEIRWWLFNNAKHPSYSKAEFALNVAISAITTQKELTDEGRVEYTMVVDNLCNLLDNSGKERMP